MLPGKPLHVIGAAVEVRDLGHVGILLNFVQMHGHEQIRHVCIVPRHDGIFSGLEFRTNLWDKYSTIPHLSRSALHRCFQRHGISRLPLSEEGQSPPKKKFKDYPIGYLHVDFAEVQTEEGKQYLPNA